MTNITPEQLYEYGRTEKKEFLKRWGYWPCSIAEYNDVSLYCVKLYFQQRSTKEIVKLLKEQFDADYEINDIENSYVHLHCLYEREDMGGQLSLDLKLATLLNRYETCEVHWLG
ncbi:hypothetical protein [Caryophanon latum]|uniref:Uncharacterized protein n=1 Tax=Caryophanon latum TaxID=33977 RepID=A0A1C0YV22_9BACL|nr:hypothetical protein [Caryophanon latum]OCS90981.1 hypothetical protein A6K76_10445 [Caryophanon latum]